MTPVDRKRAVLETVAVAVALHAAFTVGTPYLIVRVTASRPWTWFDLGHARFLGAALAGFGAYLYLWAAVRLVRRRTSAIPGLAPAVLERSGWYGVVRHPLLLGVVAILVGEAVLFGSWALAAYAAGYWLWLHLFVVFKEELDLRRAFGAAYDDYCRDVPRWLPGSRRLIP